MLLRVFTCLCVAAVLASIIVVLGQILQYRKGAATYKEIAQTAAAGQLQPMETSAQAWPSIDFEALRAINPDVCAWLYAPDASVNYPVVQGDDNDQYLNTLFDGSSGKVGSLFIDAANQPFEDNNTVIYGHNLMDGSMFSILTKYRKQEYYDEHPCLYLITPEQVYKVDLFSGYATSMEQDCWTLRFESAADYTRWQEKTLTRSDFTSKMSVSNTDRILTLSTCMGAAGSRQRYVLVGKLVHLGWRIVP